MIKFFLFLLSLHCGFLCSQPLEFKVNVSKETFLIGEPIWLKYSIRNPDDVSVEILPVQSLASPYLEIFLIYNKNKPILYDGPSANIGVESSITLIPNDSVFYEFDILRYYGKTYPYADLSWKKLDSGNYDVYGVIQGYHLLYQSNITSFTIIQPTGLEKDVYNLYCNFLKHYKVRNEQETEIAIRYLEDAIKIHPTSKYAPMCAYEIFQHLERSWKFKNKSIDITEPGFNYIKTYPLSPYVHMVIGSVILYYVNTGQFEKVQSKLFPYAKSVIPNYKCRTNIEQIYEMMVDKK